MRTKFLTVRSKDRADSFIEIGEESASVSQSFDTVVHAGRLAEQVLMKQSHSVDLEGLVRLATEDATNGMDERVRLAKPEGLAEERAKLHSGMYAFFVHVREVFTPVNREMDASVSQP